MKKLLLVLSLIASLLLFARRAYPQIPLEDEDTALKEWGERSFNEAMNYSAKGRLQPFPWPEPPAAGQAGPVGVHQGQSYDQQLQENYRRYLERERARKAREARQRAEQARYQQRYREELIRRQKELERQARQRRMQNAWTQFEFSQGIFGATQADARRLWQQQRERRERLAREGRQLGEELDRSRETVDRLSVSMDELRERMERIKVLERSFRRFDREWKKELEPDPEIQKASGEAMAVLEGDTVDIEYLESWDPERTLRSSEVPPPELPEETISPVREPMMQKVKRISENVKKNLVEICDFIKTRERDEDFKVKMVKRTTERLKESPTLKVMIGGEVVTVPSDRPTRGTTESGVQYYFRPEERNVIPIIPGYLDINLIKTPRYSRPIGGVRG